MGPTGRLRVLLGLLVAGLLAAGLTTAAVSSSGKPAATQPPRSKPPRPAAGLAARFEPPRFLLVNATTVKLRGWIRNDTASPQKGDCNVVIQTGTGAALVQSGINFPSPKLGPGQTTHFVEKFTGDVAAWVASRASGSRYPRTAAISVGTTVYCGISLPNPVIQQSWGTGASACSRAPVHVPPAPVVLRSDRLPRHRRASTGGSFGMAGRTLGWTELADRLRDVSVDADAPGLVPHRNLVPDRWASDGHRSRAE